MNFIQLIKLDGLAFFLKIKSEAIPWSGDTLKYFKPKVIFIASNLNKALKGAKT